LRELAPARTDMPILFVGFLWPISASADTSYPSVESEALHLRSDEYERGN
jgi:hypothetical protein